MNSADIAFKYNMDQLNGISEDELIEYWVDKVNRKLIPVESQVDTINKTVKCTVNHFSTYVLGSNNVDADLSNADIVFVIDRSGSMRGDYNRLNCVQRFVQGMGVNKFKLGIVVFSDGANIAQEVTGDKGLLDSKLYQISGSNGGTNIGAGLTLSESAYNGYSLNKKIVILLSDGGDGNKEQILNIARNLNAKGITVNSAFIGHGDGVYLMQDIARIGEGSHFYLNSPGDIELLYDKMLGMIDLSDNGSDWPYNTVVMYDLSGYMAQVNIEDIPARLDEGWTFSPSSSGIPEISASYLGLYGITWTSANAKYKRLYVKGCYTGDVISEYYIWEDGSFDTRFLKPDTRYMAELVDGTTIIDIEYVTTLTEHNLTNKVVLTKYYLEKLGYKGLRNSDGQITAEIDEVFNTALSDFIRVFKIEQDYQQAGQDTNILYAWIGMVAKNIGERTGIYLSFDRKTLVDKNGEALYTDYIILFQSWEIYPEAQDHTSRVSICKAPLRLLIDSYLLENYVLMPSESWDDLHAGMQDPTISATSKEILEAVYLALDVLVSYQ